MRAPEYVPWSKDTLNRSIAGQKAGRMPALDLELSAFCTGSCIYCDSKPEVKSNPDCQKGETSADDIIKLLDDSQPLGLEWVYTCGLGEPLEDPKFWNVLHHMSSLGMKLSMFTDGVPIKDVQTARELKDNGAHMILKMDTFDEANFDKILGIPGRAQEVYRARDLLLEAGYAGGSEDGRTDLAFSIVPTRLSIDGISGVIGYCKKRNIFASIGELEQAGNVINNKNLLPELGLTDEEIAKLKREADEYVGGDYKRPTCPSILTGVHVDNRGNVIVDKSTGLNCKWFTLSEPDVAVIGNIGQEPIDVLLDRANAYRTNAFRNNRAGIAALSGLSYELGGCGGNPCSIIKLAEDIYK